MDLTELGLAFTVEAVPRGSMVVLRGMPAEASLMETLVPALVAEIERVSGHDEFCLVLLGMGASLEVVASSSEAVAGLVTEAMQAHIAGLQVVTADAPSPD